MLPSEIFFFLSLSSFFPPPSPSHSFSRPVARRKLPSSLILINLLKKFAGSAVATAAAASVFLLLLFLFRVHAQPAERGDGTRRRTIKISEISL